jgi:hypothetical protein
MAKMKIPKTIIHSIPNRRIQAKFLWLVVILAGGFCPRVHAQDSIREIPADALYHYYWFEAGHFGIRYSEPTQFPNHYRSYYSPNESQPYFHNNPNDRVFEPRVADTLKSYIRLQLVDKSIISKRIHNPHGFPRDVRQYLAKVDSLGLRIEVHAPNYLRRLAAQPILTQKGLDAFFEKENLYEPIDGCQYTSPQGDYTVSIGINTLTYHYDEACDVALFHNRKSVNDLPVMSVSFKSWMASPNPLDYFWISNRELVFKAIPIRQFVLYYNGRLKKSQLPHQWIQLTIL